MYTMEVFVGIDVGGSHVSVVYMDSTGQVIASKEQLIDSRTIEPDQLIVAIKHLIEGSKDKDWVICSIGVGCPGQIKNGVLVAAGNLPLFHNFNFASALGAIYTGVQILLLNDADAAVSAEVWGKDSKDRYKAFTNVAMITLGTGIGCGLILNQQLHQGSNGLVEAGHMIVSNLPGSRKCPCGQVGCVEAYASAHTTAKRLHEADVAAGRATADVTVDGGKEVLLRYSKGDEAAVKVLEETAEHLSVLCINLCRVVDPDVIVFTGGLAKAGDVLLQLIQKYLSAKTWTILPTDVKLLTAQSIEFGGAVGAGLAAKMLLVKQQAMEKAAEETRAASVAAGAHLLEPSMTVLKAPAPDLGELVWSPVEKVFLERSGHQSGYSNEKVPTLEVTNIYELGKIVSLRFLEWVKQNPTGVVALPTGRTPEFFIKTLERYKSQWSTPEVQAEVHQLGFEGTIFPDTTNLKFVMLDEFFPMHSTHRNSFCRYIRTYYVGLLGVKDENILTFDLVSEGVITTDEMNLFSDPVVDLTLLHRAATTPVEAALKEVLLKVTAYCDRYEARVASLGGIGFFLGGIGPDGHIAFNQQGDRLDSTTRLVNFNYPSAAQAAGDLGGIEISRGKAAITIGLKTITANPDATIIIMAAGEGKAKIVRAALEDSRDPDRPASALHGHKGARFYISHGAACQLTARKALRMANTSTERAVQWALSHSAGLTYPGGSQPSLAVTPPSDYLLLESYLYEQSVRLNIPVHELTPAKLASTHTSIGCPSALLDPLTCCALVACAAKRLRDKVEAGMAASEITNKSIVHTGPHHDDIELSYHGAMHSMLGRVQTAPYSTSAITLAASNSGTNLSEAGQTSVVAGTNAPHQLGEARGGNVNHFAYLTSGFHSVNESFLQQQCEAVSKMVPSATGGETTFLDAAVRAGEITRDYDDLMCSFHNAFFAKDAAAMDYIEQVIFLRKCAEVWNIAPTLPYGELSAQLRGKVQWLLEEYLPHHNPGDNIPKDIQILKGCMRESETDRVWACSKMPMNRVHHLRSKFYTDDFFTPMPSIADDAMPMANLLRARQPHVLTVALDPEGTGPDTHYKVLLVVAAGLRLVLSRSELSDPNPLVWGYRNVWFEFEPSDATLMIPVSAPDLDLTHDVFMACFTTQKAASFPSPYHDGPFSSWAVAIQQKQRKLLHTLLGAEYFANHVNERVRNSAGFVFIKAMYANKFLQEVEELQTKIENKKD